MEKVKVFVLTISDRCSRGETEDKSGPYICNRLKEWNDNVEISTSCVPDEVKDIQSVINNESTKNSIILATGGTGLSSRDVTIQSISPLLDKHATGITTALVTKCLAHTPFAMLSNPLAGIKDHCFIVCMPGSKKAVAEYLDIIFPVLQHVLDLITDDKERISSFHTSPSETSLNKSIVPRKPKSLPHGHVCPHKTKLHAHSSKNGRGVAFRTRKSKWPMLQIKDALNIIIDAAKGKGRTETMSLPHGYVTATDIFATENVPNYPASVKDGYAVISADGPGVFDVTAVSQMGKASSTELCSGNVCRVTTGGAVPVGSDAVVQVEDTELVLASDTGEEKQIRILSSVSPGTDIRPIGSDIAVGELLIPIGTQLNAAEIGLLASQGIEDVAVNCKPTIVILSTGNELVHCNSKELSYGQVRDSNRHALTHLLAEDGYNVTFFNHIEDNMAACVEGLREALKHADVVLSTGGVSMGETDHLKDAIPEIGGEIHFGRVFMKPGKPTTFATLPGNKLYFGLPGNPVSAMTTYMLFVLPALKAWEGRDPTPNTIPVILPQDRYLDPRPEFVRAVYKGGKIEITGGQCSSRLLSMRSANVLLQLPPRTEHSSTIEQGVFVTAMVIGRL